MNVVSYSYGKQYAKDIEAQQCIINDPNLIQEQIDKAKDELFDLQVISARTQQGYTYQNLEECGFSYVISDTNLMSDAYLTEKGIDKAKLLER